MVERRILAPISKAARNERRKAVATTCNALAVAFFISAFLQPLLTGHPNPVAMISAFATFVVLQTALHYVLRHVED